MANSGTTHKFSERCKQIYNHIYRILFKQSRNINFNIRLREVLFAGGLIGLFIASGMFFGALFFSLAFFVCCLWFTLILCRLTFFQRTYITNIIFLAIFSLGIWCFLTIDKESDTTLPYDSKISKIMLPAIHHSHNALAAFFPSRGSYDISLDGKTTDNKQLQISEKNMWLYLGFHAAVYMFAGYFIILLWGCRTVNRLRFFLTRNDEKNVFWCITPEPKMLKLAADILKNTNEAAQPVFSVEETACEDKKALYQEMTFQSFCLKFRKPEQIHEKCLRAARHFFLSEDPDWNVCMAEALLSKVPTTKVNTQVYIRIKNDARKIYYTRWADKYTDKNEDNKLNVEIIFIDECSLIVDHFISEHHILEHHIAEQTPCINQNGTINKKEFKFLLIGFGGLGQEVLKHLLCDAQILGADSKPVPIHIDIIEKDSERTDLFRKQYAELCKRFSLNIVTHISSKYGTSSENNTAAGTAEFYSFFETNYRTYDRVIVALGNAALNIETIAQIEDIIRKKIDLTQKTPEEELKKWKEKLFLISPEICGSVLQSKAEDRLFTVIGADNEIYNYSDIVNEEMFFLAKLINYRYAIGNSDSQNNSTTLPVTLQNLNEAKLEQEWRKTDFYSRQSSYASAVGLGNIRLLLKNIGAPEWKGPDDKLAKSSVDWLMKIENSELRTNLGRMEHYRWWAFMLGCGYIPLNDPLDCDTIKKANQTKMYRRHATMIEWNELPKLNEEKFIVKPNENEETFQDKDLNFIDQFPYFDNIVEKKKEEKGKA